MLWLCTLASIISFTFAAGWLALMILSIIRHNTRSTLSKRTQEIVRKAIYNHMDSLDKGFRIGILSGIVSALLLYKSSYFTRMQVALAVSFLIQIVYYALSPIRRSIPDGLITNEDRLAWKKAHNEYIKTFGVVCIFGLVFSSVHAYRSNPCIKGFS